jgi:hypothetical protein
MFAKVVSQCPFVIAICILDERGTDFVSNTKMVLSSHSPNTITIIPLKVGEITLMCGIQLTLSTFATTSHAMTFFL